MTCWLSMIRFVPSPARGEFVNVAAIAGTEDDGEWEVRAVANWKRAKQLDDRNTLPAVVDFVSTLQARADSDTDMFATSLTVAELRHRSLEMQNIVQVTMPVPVAVDSPSQAIDLAFTDFVLDPTRAKKGFLGKGRARQATGAAYRKRGIPTLPRARIRTGPYEIECDFAVANGKTVQVVRCWSFQRPDQADLAQEIEAWAWGIRALRLGGGATIADSHPNVIEVSRDLDVEAVFIPPESTASRPAYDIAMRAFGDADTRIMPVDFSDADGVALRASQLLAAV